MDATSFSKPVNLLVGLGYPVKIESAMQAYVFLSETPTVANKSAHSIALKACRAALRKEIDPDTARGALLAFAQRTGMLARETVISCSWSAGMKGNAAA